MTAEIVIVKKTELANVAVVTVKRTGTANLIRQFATFTINGESRYASRIANFTTEAAALLAHERLVTTLADGGG